MEAEEDSGDRFVTLATVWTQSELHSLLTLLRTHRILAFALGGRHSSVDPAMAVALRGIRVRIPIEDLPLAVELIADVDRTPYCGPIFSRNQLANIAAVVLMVVSFCPAPARIPAFFHFEMRRPDDRE
jgi:hypothetical protein